jgi:hypothetical protein
MEIVTVIEPRQESRVPANGRMVLQPGRTRVRDHATAAHRLALAGLLVVTLLLRLWGVKQGLPFSYNSDEAQHFVPKAIGFFSGDWNPHYFLNPPGYSYVLALVFELWFGSADAAIRAYTVDPTAVFVVARVVAAVMGTASVLFTYMATRRIFDRAVALLAAAIFGLAFLPIFYSHLALNDVPTLCWVTLSLVGIGGVYRDGRARNYLLAGLGIGLAAATKYTGGITLVCLLVAAAYDLSRPQADERRWRARKLLALIGAGIVGLAAFTLANPYWILNFSGFTAGVSQQASEAAGSEPVKLGTTPGGGIPYYLWTFTWGLGLGPAIASLGGVGLLVWRRRWWLLTLFVPACVAFIAFMGTQQRYFGRWLMPIFPLVSILAAYAAVTAIRWVVRERGVSVVIAGGVVAAALLAQSIVAVIHNDLVLSRPDTINLTRAWMVKNIPAGSNVVIEPVIPSDWPTDINREQPWTPTGQRWYQYPTWLTTVGQNGKLLPTGQHRYQPVDEYERGLYPGLISHYESLAYCWVVVSSLQYARATVQPQAAPQALAYYRALARQGELVYSVSPFAKGANPVPFGFDWSIDYYPRQYRLPGPQMNVYHLTGGLCAASS